MAIRIADVESIKDKIKGGKEDKYSKKANLENKYGVMKEIPQQDVEEEIEEEAIVKEEKKHATDVIIRLERLDSRLAVFEDYKKDIEERMANIREEIGELRSTFLNLDKRFSSLEINAERAVKAVEEVEPEKITAEFKKFDKRMLESTAEIERLKTVIENLRKEGTELRNILEKIKNIENILDISRKIEEKMTRVDDVIVHADRTSAKVEVVFTELSEKLGEVERQKGKLARMDELTKELVKMLDEVSIKITKLAEKADVEILVEESIKKAVKPQEQFNKIQQDIDLLKKKMELIDEIANKSMLNEQKIQKLEEFCSKGVNSEAFAGLQRQIQDIRTLLESQVESIKKAESGNILNEQRIAKISDLVKRLTDAVSEKLNGIEKEKIKTNLYFELLQIVNILSYLSSTDDINRYLIKTREIANKMKEIGAWEENIQNFLIDVYTSLAEMWRAYEQEELSKLYRSEAEAYFIKESS